MTEKKESTAKRDHIRAIEEEQQKRWAIERIFEVDAPANSNAPKYLATFPYPYMNGKLHLGHSFTLIKVEFACNYQRLKGKQVLFPFGFHCTGMPIKACADKLKREIEQYGNPPIFPEKEEKQENQTEDQSAKQEEEKPTEPKAKEDPLAFHATKSKAKAKSGGSVYQWQIMRSMGIEDSEISKFADAAYWLKYFPPLCQADLTRLGVGVDWRRTFITTDANPYYDSFVRWQFTVLKERGKVLFGKRYAVYSPKDGQPCADHERASGEGVVHQEYTLIKIEVLSPFPAKLQALEGKKVYLVAGTLRPETMYGQTNVWVLPDGDYGAFEMINGDIFICTERAARNMAFQDMTKEPGKYPCIVRLKGWDILGIPCRAPLTSYPVVYTLPMLTISPNKGTGIVTSVPSDSPDDYINLDELQKKPQWREKFKITAAMVEFPIVDIIDVPGFGTRCAEIACQNLKVKSPKDRALLDKAKEEVYQKGFYEGKMIIGEHAGKFVRDAKPLIKEKLIATGQAVKYAEPAELVMSRSGDECVVALCDQWYLDYGETHWREEVEKHLKNMDFYSPITRNKFETALSWLCQWACSRTYGLGTRLPWDESFLIESLSDSTIYMAYYTIAYFLQGGVSDGSRPGPANIKPEQLTRGVWDYIYQGTPYPADCGIPEETLQKLRKEFNYWYPVDIRVSGKDLITNHLTFMLYNHTAIWPGHEEKWPRSMRANGHVLLNGDKMSKSTGNFLTLEEGIDTYTADGMRFALADAGDSLDDANFETSTATAALLRLYAQIKWTEGILAAKDTMRSGPADTFFDRVFASQINKAIVETDGHYERTNFREALRTGFYELQAARDAYRQNVGSTEGMNRDLILRFIEVQALIMAPIIPHFSEYIWKLIGKSKSVRVTSWPVHGEIDHGVLAQIQYLETTLHVFRTRMQQYMNPKGNKKPNPQPTKAAILVAKSYPPWMQKTLTIVRSMVEETMNNNFNKNVWPDDKAINAKISADESLKNMKKQVMGFVGMLREEFQQKGIAVLNLEMSFDEKRTLEAEIDTLKRGLDIPDITVNYTEDSAQPGKPFISFSN